MKDRILLAELKASLKDPVEGVLLQAAKKELAVSIWLTTINFPDRSNTYCVLHLIEPRVVACSTNFLNREQFASYGWDASKYAGFGNGNNYFRNCGGFAG